MEWRILIESIELESWIRVLLRVANQVVFLVLLVRFLHKKLHGTTGLNSLWKTLTVVCSTLLANYFVWPLFLHLTSIIISNHNHWALAILLMTLEWTSNRWFNTSTDDIPETKAYSLDQVPSPETHSFEQSPIASTCSHSQGDVKERINTKNINELEYIDIMNESPEKYNLIHDMIKLECLENPLEIKLEDDATEVNYLDSTLKIENQHSFKPLQINFREKIQQLENNLKASIGGVALITRSGRVYKRA
ncbi:hypothetical protein NPIL_121 [Nephila pilipes]|uniref:Uncharacterized protein n=1 Tax=Nephila pilipes TaxID=299642 RepID=A0A8X6QFK9_NEPPI|nr:hypothetical protein NPIL_121 [Nephila pilipes]